MNTIAMRTNTKVPISFVTFLATCMLFNVVLSCSSSKSSRDADIGETSKTGVSSRFGEYIDVSETNQDFKTVGLCLEKIPQNNMRSDWKPNHHKMRDLMTTAMAANEQQMKKSQERRNRMIERGYNVGNAPNISERMHVGNKTPVLGSMDLVTDTRHDAGLLSTVHEAYNRHYNLRTGPEDWWYTIIQTVALAIDNNSKNNQVRKFFVQHEGKKVLAVNVGAGELNVENIDYSWLFDQFSEKIEKNINVPEYVQQMIPDFTTTTSIHRIVSQITLMSSVQEYFEYTAYSMCGIPAIEMRGTEEDWVNLGMKIKALRQTLQPIENVIGLGRKWWDKVEEISDKLLDTYNGNPNKDWWSRIITEKSFGSGPSEFNGWFMKDLLNVKNATSIGSAPSGLVSIPLKLKDGVRGIEDQSAVIAGMMGYKFHHETTMTRPAIEPIHGWTLLLEPNSIFRENLSNWEQNISNLI